MTLPAKSVLPKSLLYGYLGDAEAVFPNIEFVCYPSSVQAHINSTVLIHSTRVKPQGERRRY